MPLYLKAKINVCFCLADIYKTEKRLA